MRIYIDYAGMKRSLHDALLTLESEIHRKVNRAMINAGDDAVEAARQSHPYTDRTGDLTASMFYRQTAWNTGEFRATTHYASFVEYGTSRSRPYPYLTPVVATFRDRVQTELNK